ncbi:MAG: phytanoyl-CoA dioxygenase family protein [Burkholderiaceae bacterium]
MTNAVPITNALPIPQVAAASYGAAEDAYARYRAEGTERALALGNRGPARFDADGRLEQSILDAYWEHGFYVFENVASAEERADLERDVATLIERAPVAKGATVDKHGRPALASDRKGRGVTLVRPLSDPLGGTAANHGRHPVHMLEPTAPAGAPEWVMQSLLGPLQDADAVLRFYGHPTMLRIAEAVNGPDFTPFNEVVWVKLPRLGGAVSWHQDGWTHWDSPALDAGTHGFNFMMQLYGCDAGNGLWVVPGSHKIGRVDIKAMALAAGSDRLPDAVPLICAPGDMAITNRQAVHGSFPNTSDNIRVTINAGFHRRRSVLDVTSGGIHNPVSTYDDAYIRHRARMLMYAIDARRQRFPDETPYQYQPLAGEADRWRWNEAARADIHDYNLQDIGI